MRLTPFHRSSRSRFDCSIMSDSFHVMQFMDFFSNPVRSSWLVGPLHDMAFVLYIRTLNFGSRHVCVLIAICLSQSTVARAMKQLLDPGAVSVAIPFPSELEQAVTSLRTQWNETCWEHGGLRWSKVTIDPVRRWIFTLSVFVVSSASFAVCKT